MFYKKKCFVIILNERRDIYTNNMFWAYGSFYTLNRFLNNNHCHISSALFISNTIIHMLSSKHDLTTFGRVKVCYNLHDVHNYVWLTFSI